MKFKAAAGETAAMTAAYFAKHKCKECKHAFYWRNFLSCAIRPRAIDHPFILLNKNQTACNRFIERPAGEKMEQY